MDLSIIKSEITVERAAALYAQIKINELSEKLFASEQKIKELIKFRIEANNDIFEKKWKESKYYGNFNLFFPELSYSLDFVLTFDEATQNLTGNRQNLMLDTLLETKIDLKNVGVNVFARPLEKNNNNRPLINLPLGSVKLIDREDSEEIINEFTNLRYEKSKDWVKTYENNITALQMSQAGITHNLNVPILPEIYLNPSLNA